MKILQNTTDFSNKQVRKIIDFVKPNNLPTSNFDVRVTHCSSGPGSGVYYDGKSMWGKDIVIIGRPSITIRIARSESKTKFPYYEDRDPKTRKPWRKVTLYYEKFNEKTQQYKTWYSKR